MSCTASMVPEQRSCVSTSDGVNSKAASSELGLMQRTKCALVELRSSMSALRSLMKRPRDGVERVGLARAPRLGRVERAQQAASEPVHSCTKSECSVSLFFSAEARAHVAHVAREVAHCEGLVRPIVLLARAACIHEEVVTPVRLADRGAEAPCPP